MISKRIDKLSIKELAVKLGFPITFEGLRKTYRIDASPKEVENFEKQIAAHSKTTTEYIETLSNFSDIFDKELYIYNITKLLVEDREESKKAYFLNSSYNRKISFAFNNNPNVRERAIKEGMDLLKDIDVLDVSISMQTKKVDYNASQSFIGNSAVFKRRREKNEARLQEIDKVLKLSEVLRYLTPSDLIQICRYPNLGNVLAISLYKDKEEYASLPDYTDRVTNDVRKMSNQDLSRGNVFNWEEFEQKVRDNIEHIDLDKMLLLSNAIYYNKYGNDFYKFTKEEALELSDYTSKVKGLLEKSNPIVASPRFNTAVDFKLIETSVKSLNNHFINGFYRDDLKIEEIINDVITGKIPITQIDIEDIKRIFNLTNQEISNIVSRNGNSFKYLYENGLIDDRNADFIISSQTKFDFDEVKYLFEIGKINEEKLLSYYMLDKIDLENIQKLIDEPQDDKFKIDYSRIASSKKLIEFYLDKDQNDNYEKYRKLFKQIHVNNRSIEEKKQVANSILEESTDLLDDDVLIDLYHQGLIPVDTLIDYVGTSALKKLYQNNEIKPIEANRLYKEGIISSDMIKDILKLKSMDETNKLVLIYSTFPDVEDKEIRDELIKYLDDVESQKQKGKSVKSKAKEKAPKEDDLSGDKETRYVSDPCLRWQFIASLDRDYSQEYLKDGHIIFYLPNKEKYIIEKLYDKGNRPAYNAATYILDENLFKKYESQIIENKKINKPALTILRNDPNVRREGLLKRVIHIGWGKAIERYFDISNPTKYSKEDMDKIRRLSKEIEESKTRIEDRE